MPSAMGSNSRLTSAGPRGALLEPPLELGHGDQDPPPSPDNPQLVKHVLVQVVAAHAEHGCGLIRAQRQALSRRPRALRPSRTPYCPTLATRRRRVRKRELLEIRTHPIHGTYTSH